MSALRQLDANTWVDLDQVESLVTQRHSSRRDGTGSGREVVLSMRSGDTHTIVAVQDDFRVASFDQQREVDLQLQRWLLEHIGLEHLSPHPTREEKP